MSDTSLKSKINETLKAKLKNNPRAAEALKKMGETIKDTGMTIEDACLLADFDFDELKDIMKHVPEIETYFAIQKVTYKKSLLSILHSHAREAADPKLALQLLSLGFSDEYDASVKKANAKNKPSDSTDTLTKLIKRVQKKSLGPPVNVSANDTEEKKESAKNVHELAHLVHE